MKKNKIILIILVVLVIGVSLGIGYEYVALAEVDSVDLNASDEDLGITTTRDTSTVNIALFGIDKRGEDAGRTDTIMILSIDYEHKKLKLSSIMRDTYVDIENHGMDKINDAYSEGGPLLAIKTINQNFNMNIQDYFLVDFDGLKDVVDTLGGVDIDIKYYEVTSMKKVGIYSAGEYHLDGEQTLEYVRIRHQGNGDWERTDRQREVLEKLFESLDLTYAAEMTELINNLLPYLETSYTKTEILALEANFYLSGIDSLEQKRFPTDEYSHSETIDGVYYLVADLEGNTTELHNFIYDLE